jgi:hypothetical protein
MPEALVALIPALIGAAGVGTSIYSATNTPGAPKPPVPDPAQIAADAAKKKQGQVTALSGQFPSIQSATGGSLSPEAWIQMAELLAGKAGEPGIGAAGQDLLQKLSAGPGLTPAGSSFGG